MDALTELELARLAAEGEMRRPQRISTGITHRNCTLEVAEELLALARPSCGPAAEDIRIAIAEYRKATGGA